MKKETLENIDKAFDKLEEFNRIFMISLISVLLPIIMIGCIVIGFQNLLSMF